MKVCHVVTVCSLMDLPLGSCDDVILQKRVSTDGGKETLIRPVLKTEILVWIEPLEVYFKGHSTHIRIGSERVRPRCGSGASRRCSTRSWPEPVQFVAEISNSQTSTCRFVQLHVMFRDGGWKLTGSACTAGCHGFLMTLWQVKTFYYLVN